MDRLVRMFVSVGGDHWTQIDHLSRLFRCSSHSRLGCRSSTEEVDHADRPKVRWPNTRTSEIHQTRSSGHRSIRTISTWTSHLHGTIQTISSTRTIHLERRGKNRRRGQSSQNYRIKIIIVIDQREQLPSVTSDDFSFPSFQSTDQRSTNKPEDDHLSFSFFLWPNFYSIQSSDGLREKKSNIK